MNNVATIEAEEIELLPAKTLLRLVEVHQRAQRNKAAFAAAVKAMPGLFLALETLDIEPRFDLSNSDSINLNFAGDGRKLGEVWGLLRKAGYKPNAHPKKGDTSFYTFWTHDEHAKIWLNFTSTMCRRVQVGTQMVEQPIYEIQCGELPELEAPAQAVVEVADEIPF